MGLPSAASSHRPKTCMWGESETLNWLWFTKERHNIWLLALRIGLSGPTCVYGPASEECSVLVDAPAVTSCMFPGDLEDPSRLWNKMKWNGAEEAARLLLAAQQNIFRCLCFVSNDGSAVLVRRRRRFYLVQPADTWVPPRLDLLLQPRPQPQPACLLHAEGLLEPHWWHGSLTGDSKSSGGIISRVGTANLLALPIRGEYSALRGPPCTPLTKLNLHFEEKTFCGAEQLWLYFISALSVRTTTSHFNYYYYNYHLFILEKRKDKTIE